MKHKDKISFKPISKRNEQLVKEYCRLLGYRSVIDNTNRKALIIDPKGTIGLLQEKNGIIHYYWKGTYEPILKSDIVRIEIFTLRTGKYLDMPKAILRKIFGLTSLNYRSHVSV